MSNQFNFILGGASHPGQLPSSFMVRCEIVSAAYQNYKRATAAALGVCETDLKVKASYQSNDFSPLKYGAAVMDELVERGIHWVDMQAAGVICWTQIAQSIPTEEEVKTAEDFTEAQEAP